MKIVFLIVSVPQTWRHALRASGSVRTSGNARLPDARPDAGSVDIGNNEDEMASWFEDASSHPYYSKFRPAGATKYPSKWDHCLPDRESLQAVPQLPASKAVLLNRERLRNACWSHREHIVASSPHPDIPRVVGKKVEWPRKSTFDRWSE